MHVALLLGLTLSRNRLPLDCGDRGYFIIFCVKTQ
jgi:hypothetical protein